MTRLIVILATLLFVRGIARADQPAQPVPKPNIVIILADDLGYGDLGCYGHPRFKTPNLDRMAAEGVRLTQFNTPMPFCAPTRAALLTGRYPFRCGLSTNPAPDGGRRGGRCRSASERDHTGPGLEARRLCHRHGGQVASRPQAAGVLPTHRGFDEYLGIPYSNDMRPVRLLEGDNEVEYPRRPGDADQAIYRAGAAVHRAQPGPSVLPLPRPRDAAQAAGLLRRRSTRRAAPACMATCWPSSTGASARCSRRLKDLELDEQHAGHLHQRQRALVRRQHRRPARDEEHDLGRRLPRAVHRPLAGPAAGRHRLSSAPAVMMDLFATALAAAEIASPTDRVIDGKDLLPLLCGEDSRRS